MLKQSVTKFRQGLASVHKRPLWAVILLGIATAFLLLVIALFVISFFTDEEDAVQGKVAFSESIGEAKSGAEYDNAYRNSISEQNQSDYERASKVKGGMQIPFIIDDLPNAGSDQKIDGGLCGCEPMSDAQFKEMLARAGGDFKGNTLVRRVGQSDVYINANRFLVNEDGSGNYRFLREDVKLGDDGALQKADGSLFTLPHVGAVFLSTDGSFIDNENHNIPLQGALLTLEGHIILGNGQIASRPDNMQHEALTDIYLTVEGQLATVDAKPIMHGGLFVFRNRERELVDLNRIPIRWENDTVAQNRNGYITNSKGDVFKTLGVLFSYDGILIDNHGKLTQPLLTINRIKNSDLYLDEKMNLLDRFGGGVASYGELVTVSVGDALLVKGKNLVNHKEALVNIDSQGALSVDIGLGGVQSGLLKNSQGVAYDRFGHLITRTGKLTQRGASDVYHTSDGLLSAVDGKPLKYYANKDIFFDFNTFLPNGSIGLRTYDDEVVIDQNSQRVYINEAGEFVTKDNSPVKLGVAITTTAGAIVKQSGSVPSLDNKRVVLTAEGKPLLRNGRAVYRREDGRLVYADNTPVTNDSGAALYLQDSGVITDEIGKLDSLEGFSVNDGTRVGNQFETVEPLLDSLGNPILVNGKPVYKRGNKLIYADGTAVTDALGSALQIDSATGKVINEHGEEHKALSSRLGRGVYGDVTALTANGEPVYINGKKVFRQADGSLVDEDGQVITTEDGKLVYYDESKGLVTASGEKVSGIKLTNQSGGQVSVAELDRSFAPLMSNGKPVFVDGKRAFMRPDGSLVDESGNPITNKDGKAVFFDANKGLVTSDGEIVTDVAMTNPAGQPISPKTVTTSTPLSANGKPVYVDGKRAFMQPDGSLIDEDGNPITNKDGQAVFFDKEKGLVTKDGAAITDLKLSTKDGQTVKPSDIEANSSAGILKALSKDGQPLFYNGKKVYQRPDGTIVDENNNPILTADGKALHLDAKGRLLDSSNNIVPLPTFTDAKGNFVSNDNIKTGFANIDKQRGLQAVTRNGEPLYYNNKKVFRRADGTLVDENDNVITTKDGKAVKLSADGELMTFDGQKIAEPLLKNKLGELVPNEAIDSASPTKLLTENGKAVYFNGRKVHVRPDGVLVDEFDRELVGDDGLPLRLNENNQVVDSAGNPVSLGDSAGRPVINGNFKTRGNGQLGDFTEQDGYIIGKDGKPLLHNGQRVVRKADGYLYTEDGKRIENKDGMPIKLNDKGEFVDAKGNVIEEALFTNGEGVLLYGNGKPVTSLMKRIGDSDMYLSRDGHIVDEKGKPYLINGQPVLVDPQTSELVDPDGKPIRDAEGNSVLISSSGKLISRDGKLSKGTLLTSSDGQLLTTEGVLASKSDELIPIPGTSYYRTKDGVVVDGKGRLVNYGEDIIRINKQGKLVDGRGRSLRYRGQALGTDAQGYIVDSKNERILIDDKPIKVENLSTVLEKPKASTTPPVLVSVAEPKGNETQITQSNGAESNDIEARAQVDAYSTTEASVTPKREVDLTKASNAARARLIARYNKLSTALDTEITSIDSAAKSTYTSVSEIADLGSSTSSTPKTANAGGTDRDSNEQPNDKGKVGGEDNRELLFGAGDNLYAVTTQQMNSDLNDELEVSILSGKRGSLVYLATAYAKVELRYDNAVLAFNRICPVKQDCFALSGIGLDPATGSAAISAAEVDSHFMYRYGSLFLASFGAGVSDGITDSLDSETETTTDGTSTSTVRVIKGLNYGEIAVKGVAETGNTLLPLLTSRVNRPVTVTIPAQTELVIKLTQPLYH
ncbi:hypothetical protein [Alteromonas stellipolaris]|uniref:hypothetical protein n=1 Tax=Alteromonas stellipolaris TaxID=233316 RepID=UPI001D8ECA85|nr:hypothetical protein [Alteromonas stellipolaris]MBZ2164174.1 hypothetical protein [Alteromonas stellipolaris]